MSSAQSCRSFATRVRARDRARQAHGLHAPHWLRAPQGDGRQRLDAAEEPGIDPEITITIDGSGLTVADNGPGCRPSWSSVCASGPSAPAPAKPSPRPTEDARQRAAGDHGAGVRLRPREAGITITSRGVEHGITLRVNRLKGASISSVSPATRPPLPARASAWSGRCRSIAMMFAVVYRHALLNQHAPSQPGATGATEIMLRICRSPSGRRACRSRRIGTARTVRAPGAPGDPERSEDHRRAVPGDVQGADQQRQAVRNHAINGGVSKKPGLAVFLPTKGSAGMAPR